MDIVGAFACSHAGLIVSHKDKGDRGKVERVYAGFDTIRREVAALRPDAIVIIGVDHGKIYTYANLPAFVIGVGPVARGIGDAGMAPCEVPVHQAAAQAALGGAMARDIDMAFSEDTKIDHSFVTPLSLITPGYDVPIVPIAINCNRPPLVSLARSHEAGVKLGQALREGPAGRAVVIGTGGLSHWVGDQARQDYLRWPAGTRFGHEAEFPVVLGERGAVNEAWDLAFMDVLARGDSAGFIRDNDNERIVREAGNGAQEIRNWLCAAGMVGDAPFEAIAYEGIPEWHTGIGLGRFRVA